MPKLTKKKAKLPHTPSKNLRRRKPSRFRLTIKGALKSVIYGVIAGFLIWIFLSSTPKTLVHKGKEAFYSFTRKKGLDLKKISIQGNYYTKKATILNVMGITSGASIFQVDPASIKNKVEALPWVRSARVQRVLPHTLRIKIAEKLPLALYQKNKTLTLVDDHGHLIHSADARKFSYLPIVIGEAAIAQAPHLFAELTKQPDLHRKLSSAILVSKRRWDLILDSQVRVLLPEKRLQASLQALSQLEKDKDPDMRDILSIDLRIPGRLYIQLKDKALAARKTSKQRKQV